eukprot:851111-Pyramimonas_sp.AAC.1
MQAWPSKACREGAPVKRPRVASKRSILEAIELKSPKMTSVAPELEEMTLERLSSTLGTSPSTCTQQMINLPCGPRSVNVQRRPEIMLQKSMDAKLVRKLCLRATPIPPELGAAS